MIHGNKDSLSFIGRSLEVKDIKIKQ